MALRIMEIEKLRAISERTELIPSELREIEFTLLFEILYDTDVFTRDSDQRGGTWGEFYDHRSRRAASVLLALHGYIATALRYFRDSSGNSRERTVYLITEKGEALLTRLKETAGIE